MVVEARPLDYIARVCLIPVSNSSYSSGLVQKPVAVEGLLEGAEMGSNSVDLRNPCIHLVAEGAPEA
jgi:hypothetical protein